MDSHLDWNHLRAFLATAETGSLSAAARRLGLTQPTLGRQVTALEERLGLTLFERKGRTLVLTDVARDLLEETRQMGDAAARLARLAEGRIHTLEGTIKITASDMTSAYVLPDVLLQLRGAAPRLRVDIVAANDVRDILSREADIAIRHVRPHQPDLIARSLGDSTAHLYASQDYLRTRGLPARIEDLNDHDFISLGDDDLLITQLAAYGIPLDRAQFRAGSASGITAWTLMRKGFGILPMADNIASRFPDAVRVLQGQTQLSFPTWLVTHRDLQTSRRIRLVFDMLADVLKQQIEQAKPD
ncbi:MAG: LysR family transcriptional regulator [Pseudomonadota bacterium]